MNYELGKPKKLDSITKEDVLKNNLWIWTWEAGLEGDFDEDWQIPVNGIDNLTNQFTEPTITLSVVGKDLIASGTYNHKEDKLFGLAIWENDSWQLLNNATVEEPITFRSLIQISGKPNAEFVLTSKEADEAFRKL